MVYNHNGSLKREARKNEEEKEIKRVKVNEERKKLNFINYYAE